MHENQQLRITHNLEAQFVASNSNFHVATLQLAQLFQHRFPWRNMMSTLRNHSALIFFRPDFRIHLQQDYESINTLAVDVNFSLSANVRGPEKVLRLSSHNWRAQDQLHHHRSHLLFSQDIQLNLGIFYLLLCPSIIPTDHRCLDGAVRASLKIRSMEGSIILWSWSILSWE